MKAKITISTEIEITGPKKRFCLFKRKNKELNAIIKGFLDGVDKSIKQTLEKSGIKIESAIEKKMRKLSEKADKELDAGYY